MGQANGAHPGSRPISRVVLGLAPFRPGRSRVRLPARDEDLLWILEEKANHNEVSLDDLWTISDPHNHNEVELEDLWAMSEPHNHNQVAGERR